MAGESTMPDQPTHPATAAEARQAVEQLVQELLASWGKDLVSAALYGSLASGEYVPGRSDVNLLLVVKDARPPALERAGAVLRAAAGRLRLNPFITTPEEMQASADVFPIKFLQMRQQAELLFGQDALGSLEISPANLRLRCEQELRNNLLRVRHMLLLQPPHPRNRQRLLGEAVRSFLTSFQVFLSLQRGTLPALEEVPGLAAETLGVEADLFHRLLALRDPDATPGEAELQALAERFAAVQAAACTLADEQGV
jgi:hypothetical protein